MAGGGMGFGRISLNPGPSDGALEDRGAVESPPASGSSVRYLTWQVRQSALLVFEVTRNGTLELSWGSWHEAHST